MPRAPFPDPEIGESIAVNGTCLTAERFDGAAFTAYASGETLSMTTLASLQPGAAVNLERALTLNTRLGGHMVSGHVDAVATVEAITPIGRTRRIRVAFPEEFSLQVIAKGSVTLDGVSLTINECGTGFLEVNVIPETQETTTIHQWTPGRRLNFETDLIGKYVQRMLGAWQTTAPKSSLTMDFLRENGF